MRPFCLLALALLPWLFSCSGDRTAGTLPPRQGDLVRLLPEKPSRLLDTLINKGFLQEHPEEGVGLMRQLLPEYPYSKDSLTAAMLYHNIGQGYARIENDDSTVRYFELANVFWDQHPEVNIRWVSNHRLGMAYHRKGNLQKAATTLNKTGLELDRVGARDADDSLSFSRIYYDIASVQSEAERYTSALKYIRKALAWAPYSGEDQAYNQLIGWFESARIYAETKQFDSARRYLDRISRFVIESPDPELQLGLMSYRANYYYQKEAFDSAAYYAKEMVRLREMLGKGSPDIMASSRYSTAGALLEQGKADEAAPYLMQAKAYYDTAAHPLADEVIDLQENLAMYYILTGQRDPAIRAFHEVIKGKKALYDRQWLNALSEMEAAYQLQEQERNIATLSHRQKSTEQQLRQRNVLLLAIGAGFLLALSLAILFWTLQRQRRLRAQKEKLELEQRLLRSQMEPHFIFNTLSVLQSMIAEGKNEKSIRYLNQFARLLRLSLENSRENLVPLVDEVEALESYISLQQMRFDNAFDYRIDVYRGYAEEELLLPPMLLQPFIENAIQHGLRNLQHRGLLHLSIRRQDRLLECTIEDNGPGTGARADAGMQKKSLSTIITRERLDILSRETGLPASLDIASAPGKGTKVVLLVPFRNA